MKKVIYVIFFFCIIFYGYSQTENNKKNLRGGFYTGINYPIFQYTLKNNYFAEKNTIPGISLGVFSEIPITQRIFCSPGINLHMNNSGIDLKNDSQIINYVPSNANLRISGNFIYKFNSDRVKDKLYLIVGPEIKFHFIEQSQTDFNINLGIGFEKIVRYFAFAPEIRYSQGTCNINQNEYIQSIKYHQIALIFNFK